ncbi:MAG: hypothetical protein AAGE52_43050 [Myxococcota bacterium]
MEHDDDEFAALENGRKAFRAKLIAAAIFVVVVVAGLLAVGAYYDYLNELPRENPYDYVPRRRVRIGEVGGVGLLAAIIAFIAHRILAPARQRVAAETFEMDGDTEDLYGEVRRNSRKAQIASLVGFVVGLAAAVGVFALLIWIRDDAHPLGLDILFPAALAGVLSGGAIRKMLLPSSMQGDREVDFRTLPAGSLEQLSASLGASFVIARTPSLLDLAGLHTRSIARYDLVSGGALVGYARESGGPVLPALLGAERPLELVVADGGDRFLTIRKGAFGSTLTIEDGAGETIGTIRRSRVPFVRALVIEGQGETYRLAKRWFVKKYVVKLGSDVVAGVRFYEEKGDDMLLRYKSEATVRTETLRGERSSLMVFAGVLAMDVL